MPYKNFDKLWRYSRIERMGAYQFRTGLQPIGLHRPLADRLFHSHFQLCSQCGGEGILTTGNGGWEFCPECEGNCAIFTGTDAEFDEIFQQIIEKFPDEATGKRRTFVKGRCG